MSNVPEGGGILPVDKPPGPTSHDMVARARRVLENRKIGHTGTLDPFASGLLLLCVGPATRLAEYLSGLPKEYLTTARLGISTDSHDTEGRVVEERAVPPVEEVRVREVLTGLTGEILQRPPSLSAKKVAGEAAHRRVRRGEAVELDPVRVTVHDLELLSLEGADLHLRVRCSSGTYVRALARDLGEALGTGAHLTHLRRTRIGSFHVEDAVAAELPLEAVGGAWIDPARAVGHLTRVQIDAGGTRRLASGQSIPLPDGDAPEDIGPVAVLESGRLVAVAEWEGGQLRPRKVFVQP